jgi:hypothetical protein
VSRGAIGCDRRADGETPPPLAGKASQP